MGQGASAETQKPWHLVSKGQATALEHWVASGGDPNSVGGPLQLSLLQAAARADQVECVEVLLNGGADVNLITQQGTALHAAASRCCHRAVNLLLRRGANPLLTNADGRTAAEVALTLGYMHLAQDIQAATDRCARQQPSSSSPDGHQHRQQRQRQPPPVLPTGSNPLAASAAAAAAAAGGDRGATGGGMSGSTAGARLVWPTLATAVPPSAVDTFVRTSGDLQTGAPLAGAWPPQSQPHPHPTTEYPSQRQATAAMEYAPQPALPVSATSPAHWQGLPAQGARQADVAIRQQQLQQPSVQHPPVTQQRWSPGQQDMQQQQQQRKEQGYQEQHQQPAIQAQSQQQQPQQPQQHPQQQQQSPNKEGSESQLHASPSARPATLSLLEKVAGGDAGMAAAAVAAAGTAADSSALPGGGSCSSSVSGSSNSRTQLEGKPQASPQVGRAASKDAVDSAADDSAAAGPRSLAVPARAECTAGSAAAAILHAEASCDVEPQPAAPNKAHGAAQPHLFDPPHAKPPAAATAPAGLQEAEGMPGSPIAARDDAAQGRVPGPSPFDCDADSQAGGDAECGTDNSGGEVVNVDRALQQDPLLQWIKSQRATFLAQKQQQEQQPAEGQEVQQPEVHHPAVQRPAEQTPEKQQQAAEGLDAGSPPTATAGAAQQVPQQQLDLTPAAACTPGAAGTAAGGVAAAAPTTAGGAAGTAGTAAHGEAAVAAAGPGSSAAGGAAAASAAPRVGVLRSSASSMKDISPWEIQFEELVLQRPIGEGSFGKVYVAKWHETLVAVKVLLDLEEAQKAAGPEAAWTLSNPILFNLQKECGLMASLRHPNVVQFMGVSAMPPAMITEYCGKGSLTDVLRSASVSRQKAAQLSWPRRLTLLLDAAKGMLYLHKRGIVHRDLKSPNLLVDSSWHCKVADFNLSKIMEEGSGRSSSLANMNPRWLAPEVVSGQGATPASDVFSFAVVMWEVLTQQLPWGRMNAWTIMGKLLSGERPPTPAWDQVAGPPLPSAVYDAYVALMWQCWAQAPEQRQDFGGVIHGLRDVLELAAS